MANLRFLVTRTLQQALVETTHETPTNPGEADANSLCLCSDKDSFVWRGRIINNTDAQAIAGSGLYAGTDNKLNIKIATNSELKLDDEGYLYDSGLRWFAAEYGVTRSAEIYLAYARDKKNITLRHENRIWIPYFITGTLCVFVIYGTGGSGTGASFSKILVEGATWTTITNTVLQDSNVGKGLEFSVDKLNINIGSGLVLGTIGTNANKINIKPGTGLVVTEDGVFVNLGKGLLYSDSGDINVSAGLGLAINFHDNTVYVALSSSGGLTSNNNGLSINYGRGLTTQNTDKSLELNLNEQSLQFNGHKLEVNVGSSIIIGTNGLSVTPGQGLKYNSSGNIALSTEARFDYNATTGELNIITQEH